MHRRIRGYSWIHQRDVVVVFQSQLKVEYHSLRSTPTYVVFESPITISHLELDIPTVQYARGQRTKLPTHLSPVEQFLHPIARRAHHHLRPAQPRAPTLLIQSIDFEHPRFQHLL